MAKKWKHSRTIEIRFTTTDGKEELQKLLAPLLLEGERIEDVSVWDEEELDFGISRLETDEEEKVREEAEAVAKVRKQADDEARKMALLENERKEYERLKAKFESA